MKIVRRGFLAGSSAALLLAKVGSPSVAYAESAESAATRAEGREITVYTTADKTTHRLSATGTLACKPMGQPLETQICVFVGPTKSFQTCLGIGGALTDSSAETYAKLPAAKQQEFL